MTHHQAHGGTDSGPPVTHDFSTNANPLGPPPALWLAVHAADRQRYPDPSYAALRERLGAAHGVSPERILPTSGGAEAIRRLSLAALLQNGLREVWVPQPGFGDYAAAAVALGMTVHGYADEAGLKPTGPALIWICEPCNPTGTGFGSAALARIAAATPGCLRVLDGAYEPLRLHGPASTAPTSFWQLHCPNKALGLTGVRAAYLIAPSAAPAQAVQALAASWVLSAEGVAMLMHWHDESTQAWLASSREQLKIWTAEQRAMLATLGWQQQASDTPFWLAQPAQNLRNLRAAGIKLRDAASFGLPGWVRIATLPPASQAALKKAIQQ